MSDVLRRGADAARAQGRSAQLTGPQLSDFARDGYLILRGLLGGPEREAVDRWTRELVEAPELSGRHWVYHEAARHDPSVKLVQRIENFCPFHAAYDRFVRLGTLTALVAELFGEPAVLFKEKINRAMHLTQVLSIDWTLAEASAAQDLFRRDRAEIDGLLHQPQEQQAARSRCSAIEAEGVLVQVIVEVRGADRSLVRA